MAFTTKRGPGLKPSPELTDAIHRYPKLSSKQEVAFILKAQNGDCQAREVLICSNLAWVCSVGGKFASRGLDYDDLITEGYFGLDRAIDQWNPKKGADLRTYSQRKILKFQSEEVQRQRNLIRLPKSTLEQLSKLRKASATLGEGATVAQLAQQTQIREKRIEQLQTISQPTSLNVPASQNHDVELLDLQPDDSIPALDFAIHSELVDLVKKLHPRQQEILELYHWKGMTFQEIGNFLGQASYKIRRIYKQSLELLRQFLVGEISEFPPQPLLQWRYYIFAKIFLATGLAQLFNGVVDKLKRLKRLHRNNSPIPVPSQQSPVPDEVESSPSPDHQMEAFIPDDRSTDPPTWHQRLWRFLGLDSVPYSRKFTHRINSGGLRDGPKPFLDHCWHGLCGLAQFLGYWPKPPQAGDQYRCRNGDRWRSRGQTQGRYQKKKDRLRDFLKIPLADSDGLKQPIVEKKIKIANNISPFLRHLSYRLKCMSGKLLS